MLIGACNPMLCPMNGASPPTTHHPPPRHPPSTATNTTTMSTTTDSGTVEQLFVTFGPDELPGVLRSLGVIFISHVHADHHFGLNDVVRHRQAAILKWKVQLPRHY